MPTPASPDAAGAGDGAAELKIRGADYACAEARPPRPAFRTLPALRQREQTRMWRTSPSRLARTERRLGSDRVLVLLFAWETLFPTRGPLPQMSQRRAMVYLETRKSAGYYGSRRGMQGATARAVLPRGDPSSPATPRRAPPPRSRRRSPPPARAPAGRRG